MINLPPCWLTLKLPPVSVPWVGWLPYWGPPTVAVWFSSYYKGETEIWWQKELENRDMMINKSATFGQSTCRTTVFVNWRSNGKQKMSKQLISTKDQWQRTKWSPNHIRIHYYHRYHNYKVPWYHIISPVWSDIIGHIQNCRNVHSLPGYQRLKNIYLWSDCLKTIAYSILHMQ